MNLIVMESTASSTSSSGGMGTLLIWLVVMIALLYFMMIRPQKNEQKKIQAMLNDMEVGDSVVTTSGMYGYIIAITDEDVIVEFGNNKNCRIPMRKSAIAQVEKAGDASAPAKTEETKPEKKKGFRLGKSRDSAKDSSESGDAKTKE